MLTDTELATMMTQVRDWTVRKGWRGEDVPGRTFGEEASLLHSEVSEAVEAYRVHGLERWVNPLPGVDALIAVDTELFSSDSLSDSDREALQAEYDRQQEGIFDYGGRKPEGVPSEMADTLIRLLDNYAEYGLEPRRTSIAWPVLEGFGNKMAYLHLMISETFEQQINRPAVPFNHRFNGILDFLITFCEGEGINLYDEYIKKMAYNETRSQRHGGKAL
jgi:hypothetical protein